MKGKVRTGTRKSLRTAEQKAIVVSPTRQLCTHSVHNSKSGKHLKGLFSEISMLIAAAKERVAVSVNAELTMLYWSVGNRINKEVVGEGRAEYGKRVVAELAIQLMAEHGEIWNEKHLRRVMQFASVFPNEEIVVSLVRQLSWTHIIALIPIADALKREFYIEMCKAEHWSVRTLRGRIASMMYERTAIAKKPEVVIKKDLAALRDAGKMSADLAFRDPYVLDFLGLHGNFSEKELEKALVADMRNAILELGGDMAFLAEQKHISVDNEDYYLDLLFFHRRLRRLVAIDLKIDTFKAEYKGQMELYLKWLEKNARQKGEKKPIGLILCAGKNEEHVELLELGRSNIRVASYMTELPPKKVLEAKFRLAIEAARNRIAAKEV